MKHFTVGTEHAISIPCGNINLGGILHVPEDPLGIIIFAHGCGSSRYSIRNQHVAKILSEANFATLLFDLLTQEEEAHDALTNELRFDIDFLSSRLICATDWTLTLPITQYLPVGYFGASTGGGAAIVAAAKDKMRVKAVVSRGGRPDLAGSSLSRIESPTLLIVGGDDLPVIEMNEKAMTKMHCIKKLEIIPGATHLFEEPGKLNNVACLAKMWFLKYLVTLSI